MKTVGIVCEYNPFHTGHKRQIDILRENGAEVIICAMSGNFSERGELTVSDKYTRAEAAVRCGADIVLELPFPYSTLSAEGFAGAGAYILSNLGCDALSFGSESDDIDLLRRAADVILSESFIKNYTESQKKQGAARSYFDLLSLQLGDSTQLLSNDILAVSYIAAIKRLGLNMDVFPIKREGAAYNDSRLGSGYPSATAIRTAVKNSENGFFSITDEHLPNDALASLRNAQACGLAPVFTDSLGAEILSFFKLMSPDDIISRAIKKSGGGASLCCDGCGIVDRLCNSAKASSTFDDFIRSAYTSRYTDARINRVILFSLIGVSEIFEKSLPEYTFLLGASEKGRKYLSNIRKTANFPIITKPADAPEGIHTDLLRLSDSFYASAMPKDVSFDHFLKNHPFMA